MESIVKRNIRDLDYPLIVVMFCISVISCVAVYTSTYGKANPATGNALLGIPPHILLRQVVWEVLGYTVMFVMMMVDYKTLSKWRWWIYGVCLFFLAAVFGFHTVNGAHSWISLPAGLSFQPSELMKPALIIWTADYMARMNEKEYPDYSIRGLLPIFGVFAAPFVLTLKEPALGQSLVMLAILYSMLLVYVQKKHLRLMVGGSAALLVAFVLAIGPFANQTVVVLEHQHILHSYQTNRLISFLKPGSSPTGAGYQVLEAEIAVGSGGVFGSGLLHGTQTTGSWIPFQWTDFIFSAIAEQLGFVGSSVLIMLFLVMLYRMVKVAATALDDFGAYLVAGSVGLFAFQIFENIGMNLVISPATGITLPFVSYGGSSLIVNFLSIGIVLSISLRRRTLRFD
ncbi:MAG: FtsW/RodA/SpoVE family cell cycle protein [Bacilli bacterium]